MLLSIQPARFLRQHDRNAVADRIGELGLARDQLLLGGVVFQRGLGQRADQDFQKLGIDAARAFGGGDGGHGLAPASFDRVIAWTPSGEKKEGTKKMNYCNGGSPSVFFLASSISVMATRISRAGLQVGRFQQRLLLGRAVGRHHRQRTLTSASLEALSISCQSAFRSFAFMKSASARSSAWRSTAFSALARDEIVGETARRYAALAVGGFHRQLLVDAEARHAGELDEIAAVAAFGQLSDAADAADLKAAAAAAGPDRARGPRAGSCRSAGGRRAAHRRSWRDSAARKCSAASARAAAAARPAAGTPDRCGQVHRPAIFGVHRHGAMFLNSAHPSKPPSAADENKIDDSFLRPSGPWPDRSRPRPRRTAPAACGRRPRSICGRA